MFRREKTKRRQPHPDPRVEVQLQRIIALRESASRKAALSVQYASEIEKVSANYRYITKEGYPARVPAVKTQLRDLQTELRQVEEEITAVHATISGLLMSLSDTDLAYLE